MAGVVYRVNTDFLAVFTKRNSLETRTFMPTSDFRFDYDKDPSSTNSGQISRATIRDNENEIVIVNMTSDEECQLLFNTNLEDYVNQVEQGIQ